MIISFEGLDGCGKSTQINMLREKLERSGKKIYVLREPGGDPVSEKIRDLVLDNKNEGMFPETELLLYIASRAQLVRSQIQKLVSEGFTLILDRYIDSTAAYQGYGRGLDKKLIRILNEFATLDGKYMPDLTFFIDVDPGVSYSRVISRNEEVNRLERAGKDFFERARKGFIEIAAGDPSRVYLIDGSQDAFAVHSEVIEVLNRRNII